MGGNWGLIKEPGFGRVLTLTLSKKNTTQRKLVDHQLRFDSVVVSFKLK